MNTAAKLQIILSGILGVNVGLLPATLYEMGVMPWLIGIGVLVVFVGLFFTANNNHLFSEIASEKAKVALASLTALLGSTIGLLAGFFA